MAILGQVAEHFYQHSHKSSTGATPEELRVQRFLTEAPACLQAPLERLLQMVVAGDGNGLMALLIGGPLLGLILLHEKFYVLLKEKLVSKVAKRRRATLRKHLDGVMSGIADDVTLSNSMKFNRNLERLAAVGRSASARSAAAM